MEIRECAISETLKKAEDEYKKFSEHEIIYESGFDTNFESFKESGGIEYTADVIWGLQLSVMNDDIFDKEENLKSKSEKVHEAKKAIPREVELVCLENRYEISSYLCKFDYYAQYDYFIPKNESINKINNAKSPVRY